MAVQTDVATHAEPRRLAVGRNTLILLAVNFSSAGFGLVLSILIARLAGDVVLGAYSLALAWALTLAQFADLGMNTLLTRDLAANPSALHTYRDASLTAKFLLAIPLAAGLLLAAPALTAGDASTRALQVGALLIFLNPIYGTYTAILRAFGRMLPILFLNVGGLCLQLFLTWLVLVRDTGADALVLIAVAIAAGQVVCAHLLYVSSFGGAWTLSIPLLRDVTRLLKAGLPFALAGILAGVEMRANVLLLGALQGDSAVGWYSAAARLSEGLRLAPNAFFGALLPALAALGASETRAQMQAIFRRGEWGILAFGGMAAVVLTLAAPFLIPFLYGNSFAPAMPVLVLLAWGLVPSLWVGMLTLWLYARHAERTVNVFLGLGLLMHIGLAVPLIFIWGVAGAALGALGSDVILCALMLLYVGRLRRGAST